MPGRPEGGDVDSFVGEVHGYEKQGAAYGYTRELGYHPLLATRAGTDEVLHVRLRKGSANTQRGAERFVDELIARVRRAGASGEILVRADSGFWNRKITARLRAKGCLYSIGVRITKPVAATAPARPLALAGRLPRRARPHPRAPRARLSAARSRQPTQQHPRWQRMLANRRQPRSRRPRHPTGPLPALNSPQLHPTTAADHPTRRPHRGETVDSG